MTERPSRRRHHTRAGAPRPFHTGRRGVTLEPAARQLSAARWCSLGETESGLALPTTGKTRWSPHTGVAVPAGRPSHTTGGAQETPWGQDWTTSYLSRYGGWRAGCRGPGGKGKPVTVQSLSSHSPLLRLRATPLLEWGLGWSPKRLGWIHESAESIQPSPWKLLPGGWRGGGLFGV